MRRGAHWGVYNIIRHPDMESMSTCHPSAAHGFSLELLMILIRRVLMKTPRLTEGPECIKDLFDSISRERFRKFGRGSRELRRDKRAGSKRIRIGMDYSPGLSGLGVNRSTHWPQRMRIFFPSFPGIIQLVSSFLKYFSNTTYFWVQSSSR